MLALWVGGFGDVRSYGWLVDLPGVVCVLDW